MRNAPAATACAGMVAAGAAGAQRPGGAKCVFSWAVGLQRGAAAAAEGVEGCWMTEAVQPLSAGLFGDL